MSTTQIFLWLCLIPTAPPKLDAPALGPARAEVGGLFWYGDGIEVTGLVQIKKLGDVYLVRWTLGDTMDYLGVGARVGDKFYVSWAYPGKGGVTVKGLSIWQVGPGRSLKGRWCAIPGNGTFAHEELTYISPLPGKE